MHAEIHRCTDAQMHGCTDAQMHTSIPPYIRTYLHTYIQTDLPTYMHAYIHTDMSHPAQSFAAMSFSVLRIQLSNRDYRLAKMGAFPAPEALTPTLHPYI